MGGYRSTLDFIFCILFAFLASIIEKGDRESGLESSPSDSEVPDGAVRPFDDGFRGDDSSSQIGLQSFGWANGHCGNVGRNNL